MQSKILVQYEFRTRACVNRCLTAIHDSSLSVVYPLMNLTLEGQKRPTISLFQPCSLISNLQLKLLYEAMQDESTELCFIFRSTRSVLYFPLENIVPEILLCIRCNKPVKVLLRLALY